MSEHWGIWREMGMVCLRAIPCQQNKVLSQYAPNIFVSLRNEIMKFMVTSKWKLWAHWYWPSPPQQFAHSFTVAEFAYSFHYNDNPSGNMHEVFLLPHISYHQLSTFNPHLHQWQQRAHHLGHVTKLISSIPLRHKKVGKGSSGGRYVPCPALRDWTRK